MKVTVARTAGFCWGVRRTVEEAFAAAGRHAGTVATLGPIIHNPQVVERLARRGVAVRQRVSDIADGTTVVVRTHGAPKAELEAARARGLDVIDGTCPWVKAPQVHVQRASAEGYHVIVVGDPEHPEIRGVVSYVAGPVTVLPPGEPLPELPGVRKVALVAQTTLAGEAFERVVAQCLRRFKEVRVFNTICDDTGERQAEARALAAEVDVVVVIGGRQSANTRHLVEICAAVQPRTHQVETVAELRPEWFTGAAHVGVCAGASTPDWSIAEVVGELEALPPEAA